jgi:hypothetical protein
MRSRKDCIGSSHSSLAEFSGGVFALSAWDICAVRPDTPADLRRGIAASDRERSLITRANGPLMALTQKNFAEG